MKKLLFFVLLLITCTVYAQVEKAAINELLFKQGGLLYEHAGYGVSIGVIKGKKVFFIAAGQRAGRHLPVDSNTLFEIGSVTKTFTALLLAQQIESGRISKNAYIDEYLPAAVKLQPGLRHKIKLTDLASHQSGLPNLSNDDYIQDLFKQKPEQPFSVVNSAYLYQVLTATPNLKGYGTYQYSNYGFALLGLLLQNAAHQPYAALLKTQLLLPYRLNSTTLGYPRLNKNTAGRFDQKDKARPAMVLNSIAPAGGLVANAADMIKYLQLQFNPPKYNSKAIRLTHERLYGDDKHVIGFGWELFPHYIEKSGDTFGNSALIRFSKKHKTGVVVLSDHQNSKLAEDIADAIFEELGERE